QHPDVRRVEQEIARLEGQPAASAPGRSSGPQDASTDSQRRSRAAIESIDRDLQTLTREERALRGQMATYERRLENTPQRDVEIKEQSRDSGTTAELYYPLLKRYEDARLAENQERRQTGQQFRVLDSALPPQMPAAPNRLQVLLLGIVLAFGEEQDLKPV